MNGIGALPQGESPKGVWGLLERYKGRRWVFGALCFGAIWVVGGFLLLHPSATMEQKMNIGVAMMVSTAILGVGVQIGLGLDSSKIGASKEAL